MDRIKIGGIMRVVFYGLTELTKKTVKKFIAEGHEVIIIDPNRDLVNEFGEEVDCGFLIGEASQPAILKEVNPKETDYFFSLSENNQNNIVACLVARSLGVNKTFLRIDDPDYETVCEELGLKDIIVPSQITSQYLLDAIMNENMLELFQFMKNKVFLYKVIATEKEEGELSNLRIDGKVSVVCFFRDGKLHHVKDSSKIRKGDEIILLTDQENSQEMIKKWDSMRS